MAGMPVRWAARPWVVLAGSALVIAGIALAVVAGMNADDNAGASCQDPVLAQVLLGIGLVVLFAGIMLGRRTVNRALEAGADESLRQRFRVSWPAVFVAAGLTYGPAQYILLAIWVTYVERNDASPSGTIAGQLVVTSVGLLLAAIGAIEMNRRTLRAERAWTAAKAAAQAAAGNASGAHS